MMCAWTSSLGAPLVRSSSAISFCGAPCPPAWGSLILARSRNSNRMCIAAACCGRKKAGITPATKEKPRKKRGAPLWSSWPLKLPAAVGGHLFFADQFNSFHKSELFDPVVFYTIVRGRSRLCPKPQRAAARRLLRASAQQNARATPRPGFSFCNSPAPGCCWPNAQSSHPICGCALSATKRKTSSSTQAAVFIAVFNMCGTQDVWDTGPFLQKSYTP
jgi:hypothetical protein